MSGWRRWLPWSAAGGLLAAMVALSEVGFALEEGYGLRTLFRLRGPIPPPADVVVLRLDNDSLSVLRALPEAVEEWPAPLRGCAERHPELVGELLQVAGIDRLPRRLQACVVELAHAAGAATIVYDVAFPASPDREAGTAELAAAIAAHGRVVLREATRREHLPGRTQLDIVTSLHPRLAAVAAGIATARLPDATGRIDQFWVRDAASPAPVQLAGRALEVSLLDTLAALARRLGRTPPETGPDARRQWLVTTALAADAAGERLTDTERAAVVALRRVHHGEAHLYFNFYGPPGTLPSLPLWQLLDGSTSVPLAGATLFIGKANLTTSREPDTFETVMTTADGVRMSGVELWATAFANLRDGTALRALPEWRRVGVVLALGVLLMLLAMTGGVTRSVVLTVAVAAAWVAVAVAAFMLWTLWLPFVGLVVLLPATLLIAELCRFARARRSAAHYMPAAVAHRVFDEVDIPTTWLDATVLLTDVVDFAARARQLEAKGRGALRAFQDRHIAMLAGAVRAEGGEVLEQTGDGVLALWTGQDHPAAACRAALAIAARIDRESAGSGDDGPPLRIRIGINSGPVTVGLIGGPERRFLTCSGDTVNMTQRLEALGKSLCPDAPPTAILLGQRTAAALGSAFDVELVARDVLRGHTEADPVYRLHPAAPARPSRPAAAAAVVLLAFLLPAAGAEAAPECPAPIARLVARVGEVSVDGVAVDPGSAGIALCADSVIVVGAVSRATLLHLAGDTMFQLEANSRVRLGAPPEADSGLVELTRGALFFISQVRRVLTVRTPSADAGIEGTEVLVAVGEGDTPALDLRVYDGRVALRPGAVPPAQPLPAEPLLAGDRLLVAADGGVELLRGDVASLRLAAARELAWTLYYPPLFPDLAAVPAPLAEASRLLAAGRVEEARAVLAAVPDGSRQAPDRDALLAVIAVSQGDAAAALPIAEAAVARQRSATTLLARSYALQALRRLGEARDTARAASEVEPLNALAWARLAELELAFGDSRAARWAADRSVATGAVPLVHVVQGFARLAAFDARGAEASFATALDADSNQPLAHLGRGLAQIRRNELEEGRRGLEAAAALDPARSLLRSYLGKAYFEERRDAAAADQLRIAKQLDPADPTPWLYDAIRNQLDNRPVEAQRQAERSLALNESRAATRSELLLSQDLATRNVSLGRIYSDLGYDELGRLRATGALAFDPASSAGHRFLSDVYQGEPRLEVARVSELLQSQLLQELGQNPIQPSLGIANLNLVAAQGPTRVSFDEFSPLFVREGIRLDASGLLGTDDTWGDEIAVTALTGRFAASIGQYRYETDGFRENNDLEHNIVELFSQAQLTPALGVQAGYRWRDTDQGDRTLNFDPDAFEPQRRESIDQHLWRLGSTWRPEAGVTVVASFLHSNDDETEDNALQLPAFPIGPGVFDAGTNRFRVKEARDRSQFELMGILAGSQRNLVIGGGLYDTDLKQTTRSQTEFDILPGIDDTTREHFQQNALSGFSYYTVRWPEQLTWTVGAGIDGIQLDDDNDLELSPKLGVEWRALPWLTVRGAAFRAVARPLVAGATIEPTQVAGFSQIYDDFAGTRSDQLAASVEARLIEQLTVVGWGAWRDLSVPQSGDDGLTRLNEDERALGAALYWTLTDELVLSAGVRWTEFEQSQSDAAGFPTRVTTLLAPVGLRWFSPAGWFAGAGLTWLDQEVVDSEPRRDQHASAPIVDVFAGYRLPRRLGTFAVEVQNVLDERFSYQDESFRTAELPNPWRLPTRAAMARLTLSF